MMVVGFMQAILAGGRFDGKSRRAGAAWLRPAYIDIGGVPGMCKVSLGVAIGIFAALAAKADGGERELAEQAVKALNAHALRLTSGVFHVTQHEKLLRRGEWILGAVMIFCQKSLMQQVPVSSPVTGDSTQAHGRKAFAR